MARTKTTRPRRPKQAAGSRTPLWIGLAVLLVGALAALWFLREPERPAFDGARAYAEVERQVAFGPRVPGSEAHDAARRYFVETLTPLADQVYEQPVAFTSADSAFSVSGTNIVASFNLQPEPRLRVLLAAHWDSRPRADRDPDPAKRSRPVPGANDGASGVAVLLEIARILHANPLGIGVDMILFDLEDLGTAEQVEAAAAEARIPFAIGSAA